MTNQDDTGDMTPDQVEERLAMADQRRLVEALLFAAREPVPMNDLRAHLPKDADLGAVLEDLQTLYNGRGIALERHGDAWAFRTAADLAPVLTKQVDQPKKLTRATLETLAIIAYHQPVTRGEIETIRGVAVSRGALDTLLEQGWIKPGRRRDSPGRPVTWLTTPDFLDHFDLGSINDLPGIDELKAAGLLDARPAVTALAERFPDAIDEAAAADADAQAEADEAEEHAVELGSVLADDDVDDPDATPDLDALLEEPRVEATS
ncbi:MAG: SMC-Scp complex subunit ScpB [Pseudomonadota bacterium]